MRVLLLLASLCLPAHAIAGPTVQTWVRSPGASESDAQPPANARPIDLGRFRHVEARLFDPQYQSERSYRGVPLASVLASLPGGPALDTALLRFDNGMLIPISRWPDSNESPFFALAHSNDGQHFDDQLPEVPKKGHTDDDPRPIRFAGHKLVYRGDDARELPAWNPWRHVSSLVAIELVNGAAWARQFPELDARGSKEGRALYDQYCAACHGVRGVGARFGWDVVSPIPLARHRTSPGMLYYHVKFRELDAAERGFMMPAIPPITEAQAAALFAWLKRAAEKPLEPYAPPASQ